MAEYLGKINIPKDTMLFVVNTVFSKNVKESTTKENILKMMPKIFENAESSEIIKLLPYKAYIALEKLINYVKTSDDIKKFFYSYEYPDVKYLEQAMIIVSRAKHTEYIYSLNPGVIEKLRKLFSKENRELAKRYGRIENLTMGLLYSYGVVDFDFLRTQISKFMSEIISEDELHDIYFKRLNLNIEVTYYDIEWTDINKTQQFVTYLHQDEADIGLLIDEQKIRGFRYKKFKEHEVLDRREYLWDKSTQRLYEYLKNRNKDILEYSFIMTIKKNELGENILGDLLRKCTFESESDINEFIILFTEWYNNSPQYLLGGYSPIEFCNVLEKK